jgi:hypothetical protein
MKLNPKKLSFSTLAILFAVQLLMALFAGVLFANAIDILNGDKSVSPYLQYFIAAGLFVAGHFFRVPENVLAELTINDVTYAGEFYDVFLSKILLGFETAQKGLVKIQAGIKKKATVGTFEMNSFIQASQDPPVFGANLDVGGRVLEPKEVMGYLQATPAKFEDHWLAVQMNPALLDRALPMTFESAVVDRTAQLSTNWLEQAFWKGSYDGAAITTALGAGLGPADNNLIFFDGIVKITKAALANSNKITTAVPVGFEAVVLTAGNIKSKFDQLKGLIMASPDGPAAYNDPNFVFVVNYKTGDLYGEAVKAQANKGDDFTGRGKREYDGRRIVEVFGQHDDTIWAGVATRGIDSQLWLGANEADEWTKFRVAKLQANSEKMFVKMLAKLCTQIATPSQVFLYTTK